MKTKELIKRLQEEDPTGEIECCVGNVDIHFVSREPAYWDGPLQVLERDPAKEPYYNIVGGKYIKSGEKIQINLLRISDIFDDPKVKIDYSQLGPEAISYKESDDKTIEINKKIKYECEFDLFYLWAKEKAIQISGDPLAKSDVESFFKEFYVENRQLPLEKTVDEIAGKCAHDSYNNRRKMQWDNDLKLSYLGLGEWKFERK
jgi:hypothetical protein